MNNNCTFPAKIFIKFEKRLNIKGNYSSVEKQFIGNDQSCQNLTTSVVLNQNVITLTIIYLFACF